MKCQELTIPMGNKEVRKEVSIVTSQLTGQRHVEKRQGNSLQVLFEQSRMSLPDRDQIRSANRTVFPENSRSKI